MRALMVCETCGQRWLFDFLDSAEWGGAGDGRVIYAPVPQAITKEACGALTTGAVEALRPRLVVDDATTARYERVA